MSTDHTISYIEEGDAAARSFVAPYLVLALECARPTVAGARLSIAEVEVVSIGRGAQRGWHRTTEGGRAVLRIDVPDGWMSSKHFRLEQQPDRTWHAVDAGSKNGTFVSSERITRRALTDGEVVAAGGTLFLFRDSVRREFREPADVDAGANGNRHPAEVTLSLPWARALSDLARIATSPVAVIVRGETGTGKELVARLIHATSKRTGAFVPINCGAIADTLIESELFGYRKGAFSGATENRPGLLRSADGGTVFLDEIAELPEASQVALLRVLQEREVVPVGGTRAVPVDVRVVAATHEDLSERVEAGAFRRDLYARLSGFELEVPPLRERREDIGVLAGVLLRRIAGSAADAIRLQRDTGLALLAHDWPMNVRELEQALSAAYALGSPDGEIAASHLPAGVRAGAGASNAGDSEELSDDDATLKAQLEAALKNNGGNVSAVARDMGKARVQIRRWCKRFGLDPANYRD
jgi:transcriptional regulator with PAS, ATPase and Fis domain